MITYCRVSLSSWYGVESSVVQIHTITDVFSPLPPARLSVLFLTVKTELVQEIHSQAVRFLV